MLDQLLHIDHQLFDLINQGCSNSFFNWLMPILRNKLTWVPFYILGAIYLLYKKKNVGIVIILSGILSIGLADGISSHLLKPAFERTRPCLLPDFAAHVNLVVERCSGAASFPSSHAANHFALAILLSIALYKGNKLLPLVLIIWASLICFAQVYVGVHFPSDVFAGALLGTGIGIFIAKVYQSLVKRFLLPLR